MPNIKSPYGVSKRSGEFGIALFSHDGTCYKCGNPIYVGTFNWTFDPRNSSKNHPMYAHKDCAILRTPEDWTKGTNGRYGPPSGIAYEPQKPIETKIEVKEPEPIPETPKAAETPKTDITDKIVLAGKHKQTRIVKSVLRNRRYPFLYGAPGAGKTHLIQSIAQDMGLDFVLVTGNQDMLKSEVIGAVSQINQVYMRTDFRNVWENGGVILFDEVGLMTGAFTNLLNAALAQRLICFPDLEKIEMHPNCFIVFADNSRLYGGAHDPLFPERNDLGNAFRDRIFYVRFEYDEVLELRVLTLKFKGDSARASQWHRTVKTLRSQIKDIPIFVSPRFAYDAAEFFLDGELTWDEIIEGTLYRGQSDDVISICSGFVNAVKGRY